MNRHSASLSKAIAFLQEQIPAGSQQSDPRLPPISKLCTQAKVAHATMWKAVNVLQADGFLSVKPRTGIRVVSSVVDSHAPSSHPTSRARGHASGWRGALSRLQNDLTAGVYPPETLLPPRKELVEKYGVCHVTLRKVLSVLVDNGSIEPYKKEYRVPGLPNVGNAMVILIARGGPSGSLRIMSPRIQSDIQILEANCAQKGVTLARIAHDDIWGRHFRIPEFMDRYLRKAGSKTVLGFVVWAEGAHIPYMNRLRQALARYDKPVSIQQAQGKPIFPLSGKLAQTARLFANVSEERAGEQVARYLYRQGHRRIAFISPFNKNHWSSARQRSIQRTFDAMGLGEDVFSFTHDHLDNQDYEKKTENIEGILEGLIHSRNRRFQEHIRLSIDILNSLEHRSAVVFQRATIREGLRPLLDRAFKTPNITAWVGANDNVALECLDFLAAQKTPAHGEISVIGFDDMLEASLRGLTSYSFNSAAFMHAMLQHVLNPQTGRRLERSDEVQEVEGFITPRQSTARILR